MKAHRQAIQRSRGFTLIEILVVLALIALLTGMAVMSTGVVGDPVTREARRLAATLRLAVDESRLQGRVLGLRLDSEGYSYLELVPGDPDADSGLRFAWNSLTRKGALAPRAWPAPLELALTINGRPASTRVSNRAEAPQIVLLPGGEFTPFSLRLSGPREAVVMVRFSAAGQLDIQDS